MADPAAKHQPDLTFSQPPAEKRSWLPWTIAGVVVVVIVVALVLATRGTRSNVSAGGGLAALDPYASNLAVSDLKMSEASNFAGGKVTYLDGQIADNGSQSLTGITVQVVFRDSLNQIALRETMPLTLIRTREPYVDTEPVSAAPIKPGDHREFRLIFDNVPADWNQQFPEIRIVKTQAG